MTKFIQPQNREADLQAILEGYEDKIQHSDWLSDAFQKDGIQNSWDGRINRKGRNWSSTLFVKKNNAGGNVVGIVDSGTTGLTGTIPQDRDEIVRSLLSENPKERLSYFLSSNWSRKAKDALGSRGRGKMVFIGSSRDKIIYFDSLRSDDGKYVFGATYLDSTKSISVEVYEGEAADKKRREIFGNLFKRLTEVGTRVLIPKPTKELVQAFHEGSIEQHVQRTWWEILEKYNAKILIEVNGSVRQVPPSAWIPVTRLGVKEMDSFENIALSKYKDLKIKRISFAYLGDKEIPDSYKGLAIQRHGMVVQRLPISNMIGDSMGDKIIGTVELESKFETALRDNEAPEHYTIFWTRSVPAQLRLVLKENALKFARRYKLIEKEKQHVSKEQRQAEVAVQKRLNALAKTLGFSFGSQIAPVKRKKKKKDPNEPLRLSIPDFSTPYEGGRVDFGQSVVGTYAIPINEYDIQLKILVRAYVVHNDTIVRKNGKELLIEKEISLPSEEPLKIGWPEIEINKSFSPGQYTFKAKMVAMEDKKLNGKLSVEKGEELYHTLSRTFYVEEDPEEKGIFKFQRDDRNDKSKYYWWGFEDRTWIIYYNGKHPVFESLIDDSEMLMLELNKIGVKIAFTVICSNEKIGVEEKKRSKVFDLSELRDSNFEELVQSAVRKQSKILWDWFKS